MELQEIHKYRIIIKDFKILLLLTDRRIKESIASNLEDLNNMTNKINVIDITYHYIQSCTINTFFLNAHKTLTMSDHLLTLKQILTNLKELRSKRVNSLVIIKLQINLKKDK